MPLKKFAVDIVLSEHYTVEVWAEDSSDIKALEESELALLVESAAGMPETEDYEVESVVVSKDADDVPEIGAWYATDCSGLVEYEGEPKPQLQNRTMKLL